MRQGVRLRHVRLSPRDARVTTPRYRTDLTAHLDTAMAVQQVNADSGYRPA